MLQLRQKVPEMAVWKWIDGEDFSYKNWAEGQPDSSGYSVKIVPDWEYKWDDCEEERHPFICEIDSE